MDEGVKLSDEGRIVGEAWLALPRHYPSLALDSFVVMPNHVHGILVLEEGFRAMHPPQADVSPLRPSRPKGTPAGSVSAILQSFKATTSRRVRSLPELQGVRLWQRGFYDHVIRDDAELNRLRRYIEENPLRWALDEENPQRSV
jgi:REP element-mobilizing transposase RayT